MNKLSKEINVVNAAQYEVACEEWQYNGWQTWPVVLPQYCCSIIIAAPTPPFSTSLSLRPVLHASLFLPPPLHLLGWKDSNQTSLTWSWQHIITTSLNVFQTIKIDALYIPPSTSAWCTKNTKISQRQKQYFACQNLNKLFNFFKRFYPQTLRVAFTLGSCDWALFSTIIVVTPSRYEVTLVFVYCCLA